MGFEAGDQSLCAVAMEWIQVLNLLILEAQMRSFRKYFREELQIGFEEVAEVVRRFQEAVLVLLVKRAIRRNQLI